MAERTESVSVFYSYSHKDELYREELETHLTIMRRQGIISDWHFRKIIPGQNPDKEIHEAIDDTDLFLVLVSSDFIASDYCYDIELKRALERREAGKSELIPIILRPVDLTGAPIDGLQALPTDARPVSTWSNVDEAWLSVAKGIRLAAENILELSGKVESSAAEEDDGPGLSEEDFGIVDFMAEFNAAMELAAVSQQSLNERTETATDLMAERTARINRLAESAPPDMAQRARKIAGSMASDLTDYASSVDSVASELKSAWDRVDKFFPKMIEAAVELDDSQRDDLPELKETLAEAKGNITELRETILTADEQISPLGQFAASLKLGTRRTHKALTNLADVYWDIENSIGQMIGRVEGLE